MTAQIIDRKSLKAEVRELLRTAQVSPRGMAALYLALRIVLSLINSFTESAGGGFLGTFVSILVTLMDLLLAAGFVLYCMAIRRRERAEYLTLFDGFAFTGKVIALNLLVGLFIFLWSMLFAIPGIIAYYRYRFALLNLYENPGLNVFEALNMSKRQTVGYKSQLFLLDLSYLGWGLLASLPNLVIYGPYYRQMFTALYSDLYSGGYSAATTASAPALWMVLLTAVWALAVQLFYLPNFQCAELGYFEIAQQTSGIRPIREASGPSDGWNGPDGSSF